MAKTAMQRLLGAESAPPPPEASTPKEEAAQDLIDAITDKDAKATALAFAALYELCADHGEEDEGEDEAVYEG